jgi:PIN domain nuclease of toxin-antitoxin system
VSARYQLDASALIALLSEEPGGDAVEPLLDDAEIHAFNLAEVIAKLLQRGAQQPEALIATLQLDIGEQFTFEEAVACARLHATTRAAGLSMGDCICLSQAQRTGRTAITADREWGPAVRGKGIHVRCIR